MTEPHLHELDLCENDSTKAFPDKHYTITEAIPFRHLECLLETVRLMVNQLPNNPFADRTGLKVEISGEQAWELADVVLDIVQCTDPQFVRFDREKQKEVDDDTDNTP